MSTQRKPLNEVSSPIQLNPKQGEIQIIGDTSPILKITKDSAEGHPFAVLAYQFMRYGRYILLVWILLEYKATETVIKALAEIVAQFNSG